jgi:hypothetical protein
VQVTTFIVHTSRVIFYICLSFGILRLYIAYCLKNKIIRKVNYSTLIVVLGGLKFSEVL